MSKKSPSKKSTPKKTAPKPKPHDDVPVQLELPLAHGRKLKIWLR